MSWRPGWSLSGHKSSAWRWALSSPLQSHAQSPRQCHSAVTTTILGPPCCTVLLPRALITVIHHPAWQSAAISPHRLSEIIDSPNPTKRSLLYILPLQLSAGGTEQLSSPLNIFLAVISLPALSAGAINMQRLARRLAENGSYFFPTLHAVITSHKVKSIFPIRQSSCNCSTPSLAPGGWFLITPPTSFLSPHVNSWGWDLSWCEDHRGWLLLPGGG